MDTISLMVGVIIGLTLGVAGMGIYVYPIVEELRLQNAKLRIDLLHK